MFLLSESFVMGRTSTDIYISCQYRQGTPRNINLTFLFTPKQTFLVMTHAKSIMQRSSQIKHRPPYPNLELQYHPPQASLQNTCIDDSNSHPHRLPSSTPTLVPQSSPFSSKISIF